MLYRLVIGLIAAVGLFVVAVPALANQPAEHFTEDVTGDVFVCDTAEYTITSGTISIVFHEGTAASGNQNVTGMLTLRNVIAVDGAGNEYSIVGASWFGGTVNASTGGQEFTATEKFQIVRKGGAIVDSVNVTAHITDQPNNTVDYEFDFGTCASP